MENEKCEYSITNTTDKQVEAQQISWDKSTNPSPTQAFEPKQNTDYIKYIIEALCIFALCFIFMATYKYCLRTIRQYWRKLTIKNRDRDEGPVEMSSIPMLPTQSNNSMNNSSKDMTPLTVCTIHDNPLEGPFIHENKDAPNATIDIPDVTDTRSHSVDASKSSAKVIHKTLRTPVKHDKANSQCDPLSLTWFTI